MPERTVLLGLMTYQDEAGNGQFGLQGEVVQVHDDYVERFDSLNIDPGPKYVVPQEPIDMVAGGGAETPVGTRRPARRGPTALNA